MSDLKWKKAFEIGHQRIDFEHKIFFDLIESLDKKVGGGLEQHARKRYLEEIRKYAEFHFVSEENIMLDHGFPLYEQHKQLHKKLIAELKQFINEDLYGEGNMQEFLKFLYDWFLTHTTEEDKKISRYLEER